VKIRIAYKICVAFGVMFWLLVLVAGLAYFNFYHIGTDLAAGNTAQLNTIIGDNMRNLVWELGTVILLGFAISLAFTIYIIRNVNRPVKLLTGLASRVSGGDLTANAKDILIIKTNDELEELGESFREMYQNIKKFLSSIFVATDKLVHSSESLYNSAEKNLRAVEQVTLAIDQISAGSQAQSADTQKTANVIGKLNEVTQAIKENADRQNENVNKTVSIINQMSVAIDKVAENTRLIADDTQNSYSTATEGKDLVDETITGMKNIKTMVDDLADKMTLLGKRSEQIGEIVQVIDNIAEQTNLLALNAAIEAARAGEHGKGFAVVADEVRKLAENSRRSTEEIRNLIIGIQNETETVVAQINQATVDVEARSEVACQAGTALREIITAVNKVVAEVDEINTAIGYMKDQSREMVGAVDIIASITQENSSVTDELLSESKIATESITNVSAVSQQNAASTQEVNASAQQITATTLQIKTEISNLNDLILEMQKASQLFKLKD